MLTKEDHAGKVYNLTGPEALTYGDAAAQLSKVAGRKIAYQHVDPPAWKKSLLSIGMPEPSVDYMNAIFTPVREGHANRVTKDLQAITGRAPRAFADYAKENAAIFR